MMIKNLLKVVALMMPFYATAKDQITDELVSVFIEAAEACNTTYTGLAGILLKSTCKKTCTNAAKRTKAYTNYQQGGKQIKKDVNACVLTLNLSKKRKPPILVKLKHYQAGIKTGTWPESRTLAKKPRQQSTAVKTTTNPANPAPNRTEKSIFGDMYISAPSNIKNNPIPEVTKLSLATAQWTSLNAKQMSLANEIYQQALTETRSNKRYNPTDADKRKSLLALARLSNELKTELASYQAKHWLAKEVDELATQGGPSAAERRKFTQMLFNIAVVPLMEQFIKAPESLSFVQFADLHQAVQGATKSKWRTEYGVSRAFIFGRYSKLLSYTGVNASLATVLKSTHADRKVGMEDFLADSITDITGMDPMMAKIEAYKEKQREQHAIDKQVATAPPLPSPPYRFDWAEIDQINQFIKSFDPSNKYPQGIATCAALSPDSPNRKKGDFKTTMGALYSCPHFLSNIMPAAERLLTPFVKEYSGQYQYYQ
jgi:hypothetical protein